jgi:acyl carrier protein
LKEFPLTPNGKLDIRNLPAPDGSVNSSRVYVAPETEDQQKLGDIWCEVLLLSQIGLNENFFDLGADSLSATRAFARINNAFNVHITLRDIFDHPTIGELIKVIRNAPQGRNELTMPIQPSRRRVQKQ